VATHNELVRTHSPVHPVTAAARAVARTPFTARALRELLFCLIEVPLGLSVLIILAALPLPVALLTQGGARPAGPDHTHLAGVLPFLGLAAIFLVLALVVLVPLIARRIGTAHRRLAQRLLGEQIAGPAPARRGGGPARWVAATLRDGPGWRAAGYLLVQLPLAVLGGYAALIWWGAGLINMTYPLWWPWFRNHSPGTQLSPVPALTPFGTLHVVTFPGTFAVFAAGAAMVAAAPWVTRAVVSADRWLMRQLLGPGRLARRVASLEQARALAVDDSAALLRRLERNLHDGAQIRLATLAMNLGMAMDKLGTDGDRPNLPAIRELVGNAHQGAKDALAELRELARGMHPPALDHGLAEALATLAANSPIPVGLTTGIRQRPSPAIETIAYFCAAELLANAVKHSGASKITITVAGHGERLTLQVADDGHGGAQLAASGGLGGLAGLAQRVRTVDGRLEITSPAGGPTQVTVTLPQRA
jgi:signal transduction histidine kinase